MQMYQSTPDYYRDVIQHGWAKDTASKVHKYIKRWKNKAGKWVYQYKNKKPETHISYPSWNDQNNLPGPGKSDWVPRYDASHRTAARGVRLHRYEDIQRARNNAKLKAQGGGNVRDRGYSSSQGSGESKRLRNLGTRKSKNNRRHYSMDYIREKSYNSKKNRW